MEDSHFEEITEDYLAEILEIYNYYVENTTTTFHAHTLNATEMRELVFFENPKYQTYVILVGDEVCGYVILTQHKKRETYDATAEVTIYLKAEWIGKDLGTRALTYIESVAQACEIHTLIATICGENAKSIRLFENNGYSKCAHYKEVGKKFGNLLDVVAYQKIFLNPE